MGSVEVGRRTLRGRGPKVQVHVLGVRGQVCRLEGKRAEPQQEQKQRRAEVAGAEPGRNGVASEWRG